MTPAGGVKVLDFGLANALASASDVPSLTATPTEVGVIMGTPAYMSLEQAGGEVVGRQADIWSFGVVLLELLTGVSPFGRQTTADTLASVLATQPDYSVLPSDTPANVRDPVRRCLEKDLKRRLRDIGDVRIEVEKALSAPRTNAAPSPADALTSSRRRWRAAGAIALAALVVVVIGGAAALVWAPWRSATGAGQAVPFELGGSDKTKLFNGPAMALSPDGHWMVFPTTGDDASGATGRGRSTRWRLVRLREQNLPSFRLRGPATART